MELMGIREKDKKTLATLAVEHGEIFLNKFRGSGKVIGIYGCDCEVMDFFEKKLNVYFLEMGEAVKIRQNSSVGYPTGYSIDVSFFLRAGYVNGLNKDVEHIRSC